MADGSEVVIRTAATIDAGPLVRLDQELAALGSLEGTGLVRPVAAGRQGGVLHPVVPYVRA